MRRHIIRLIRSWNADLVLTHRPNDYHPDHRATSQLVQDSAYIVLVPNICPDMPALRHNPVYLYLMDDFRKPNPFTPDIAVAVDDVWDKKLDALDAHASQFYEWLPWVDWTGEAVPEHPLERRRWLAGKIHRPITEAVRQALAQRYGAPQAAEIRHAAVWLRSRRPSDIIQDVQTLNSLSDGAGRSFGRGSLHRYT